ncbi:MAG: FKBP-type peptidyl-prolyl cis-trans isomerase [Bacteroidales bacterium]|nr:FKBP-type peptidyl-prolyl cis-trans isomerase [Bacteroidales bacterium]
MKTNSGLEYTIVEQGNGAKAAPGKIVRVHYTGYFENGTIFDSSVERGEPIEFPLGKGMVIAGWEEGISLLRVGDKAKLYIPYQLAYGESGRGPIPAKSNLIFDVELVEVKEIPQVIPFNVEGKDTIATGSGLKYIVVGQGNGKKAEVGKVVTVHYSGYLTNGEMFDSSVQRGQTFKFILGQGQVISGWDEGVALMNEGSRYRLIIPSNLGYGNREIGPIPAGSTLIFDVELIKVD